MPASPTLGRATVLPAPETTVRTRSGFTPVPERFHQRFRDLEKPKHPFTSLPEVRDGRWGDRLTAAKMKDCRWLKPELVGQFEFVEWTSDNHLRHSSFIALRDDKDAKDVRKETATGTS